MEEKKKKPKVSEGKFSPGAGGRNLTAWRRRISGDKREGK